MALPRVPKRLRDLVDAACDDTITADGSRELEGILRRDDEARQYYLLYFHMVSHVRINVVTDLAFHEVCQQIERQQQLEQSLAAQPADEPAEKEPVAVDDGPPPLRTLGFRTAFSREIRFAFLVATVVVVAILGVLATLQVSAYRQMAIGTSASQAPVAGGPPCPTTRCNLARPRLRAARRATDLLGREIAACDGARRGRVPAGNQSDGRRAGYILGDFRQQRRVAVWAARRSGAREVAGLYARDSPAHFGRPGHRVRGWKWTRRRSRPRSTFSRAWSRPRSTMPTPSQGPMARLCCKTARPCGVSRAD